MVECNWLAALRVCRSQKTGFQLLHDFISFWYKAFLKTNETNEKHNSLKRVEMLQSMDLNASAHVERKKRTCSAMETMSICFCFVFFLHFVASKKCNFLVTFWLERVERSEQIEQVFVFVYVPDPLHRRQNEAETFVHENVSLECMLLKDGLQYIFKMSNEADCKREAKRMHR